MIIQVFISLAKHDKTWSAEAVLSCFCRWNVFFFQSTIRSWNATTYLLSWKHNPSSFPEAPRKENHILYCHRMISTHANTFGFYTLWGLDVLYHHENTKLMIHQSTSSSVHQYDITSNNMMTSLPIIPWIRLLSHHKCSSLFTDGLMWI